MSDDSSLTYHPSRPPPLNYSLAPRRRKLAIAAFLVLIFLVLTHLRPHEGIQTVLIRASVVWEQTLPIRRRWALLHQLVDHWI